MHVCNLGLYVASLENNWEYKSVDPTFALRIGSIYPAHPAKQIRTHSRAGV